MIRIIPGVRPSSNISVVNRNRGFSLIEVMMTVVLLAVSFVLAIPSFRDMVEKRQVTNGAEQLASFINTSQGISMRTNQVVTVSFDHDGLNDWCVGATLGETACDCDETEEGESDYCEIDSQHFVMNQGIAPQGELVHSISGDGTSYSFDPVRGLFTDMNDFLTMELQSKSQDFKLNLMVIPTGKVTLCSKDADHAVPGYAECPDHELPTN